MAANESAVLIQAEYQVFQNGEWQWVNAPWVSAEVNPIYLPGYDEDPYRADVFEIPNSALAHSVRVTGIHSSKMNSWVIKVSQGTSIGQTPAWNEILAYTDGEGRFGCAVPGGDLGPNSFIYCYISFAEMTPAPIHPPVHRLGVLRINTREF